MHTRPGAELVSARAIERTLQRQREALAVVPGAAGAGLLVPPPGSERLLGYIAAGAAAGRAVAEQASLEADRKQPVNARRRGIPWR